MSGWWGMVRHPNYLGDLIMALAWSLPCGEWPMWIEAETYEGKGWLSDHRMPTLGMHQ